MISMIFSVKTFMEMNMRPWKLTLDIDATHKYDGENSGTKVAYFVDTMASKAWCQTITSYNINVLESMAINKTMTMLSNVMRL